MDDVKPGLKVKITKLGKTTGMIVKEKYLKNRKVGVTGIVVNYVPGHGGDVWFVQHDNDHKIAVYCFDEFEAMPDKNASIKRRMATKEADLMGKS